LGILFFLHVLDAGAMNRSSPLNPPSISNLESRISNHFIYTGSFAALEMRWVEVIAALQRDDPLLEINVLIGSNILASYLRRRLAESGRTVANVRFHTFLDLAARLAAASDNALEKPRLPRLGASILLENTLAQNAPSAYASLSGFRGFRDALLDTFRDLRDAGFGAKELAFAIQAGNRAQDRRQHLLGFADLYRRFREQVSFFRDDDDDFRAAIRNLAEHRLSLGFTRLLVYGIYDATGQQSRLLASLKDALHLIYFIPFVDETVSDFARPFLMARVEELGVKPAPLHVPLPLNSLGNLATRGFGFSRESAGRQSLDADGSFAIVSAPGESRAAVEIVREIFRAAHDRTIAGFHEAAVILRQPESDIPVLAEALRLHGVPHFIHGGGRFADHPLSKAILALSSLESNSFSREAVLTAMELVAASLPEAAAAAWDVQSWRILTNDPRFLAGLPSWDAGTEALVEQARRELAMAEEHPDATVEDESESGAKSIQAIRERLESARSLRDAWRVLRQAAADWPEGLSWQDWARFIEQRLDPIVGASGDWTLFSNVLDELEGLPGFEIRDSRFEIGEATGRAQGEWAPAEKMRSALAESISSFSCPVGRFQRSGVNILSTSAARGLRFPLVIIPGLEEGRFPAKLRQDPLLLDSERLWIEGLPIKSKRADEEKLLFDMAARSAERRLVLMTSRLDESSDRERIPSQFLLRAAAAVRGSGVTLRDLTQGTIPGFRSVSLDNPAPLKDEVPIDEGEIRLRLVTAERGAASTVLDALAKLEPSRLSRSLAFDRARWKHRLSEFDGRITDLSLRRWAAQKIGPAAGPVSASRIEEYAKCPYFFFLKRVIGLEAWKEQGRIEGMDPLDRGLVIHSILESFLKNRRGGMLHEVSEQKLLQQLESLAREDLEKSRPVGTPDLLWEIERDALMAVLKNWLVFERRRAVEGMVPLRFEQVFGEWPPQEKHPSFRLKAGKHTFDFRGRIDRIDVSRDGTHARVIDYKTGTLPESMAKRTRTPLMSGERIQIVVYRGALSTLDEFKSLQTVEGEYLHLQPKDGRAVSCSFTDEELQKASGALKDILEIIGDSIENGMFFARTSGRIRPSGHCEYCDYLPICGKDRVQREERKADDPDARKFLRVLVTE
jgi:RecB family exonuclease